ncbi:MAG: 5-(carboxyamino)imidazole ribonucleotide mutase [Dehalococcoidia bacterium]|nr:5-(carboxyamino)imidazole ribonucleotide mutase [Dehalococcoidia bacterium]
MPQVGVIIGSKSDEGQIQETLHILEEMGVAYEMHVLSAHRTPQKVADYARTAQERGIEVIIAAAGGAAALPGALAAWTDLPVIGVPLPSSELKGADALYSIVQMPPGVPVACVAIGSWGARNAAYLAAGILSLKDGKIREAYSAYRKQLREG